MIPRLIITAGEPAGIGPDLVIALSKQSWPAQLVICANKALLEERAKQIGIKVHFLNYQENQAKQVSKAGQMYVLDVPLQHQVIAGQLNPENSEYVLQTLTLAANGCLTTEFDALITGPVHKGVINQSGIPFTGHTEFFADISKTKQVVMMLATEGLRVSLVTTHLPLKDVSAAITPDKLESVIHILHQDLVQKFNITAPKIYVCGLNPHAGEDGALGKEENEIIIPTLDRLKQTYGYQLIGPLPADTIFNPNYLKDADTILAMYHDQGLPVLKYKGFGHSVNITLGLPFIRTSVDHGTALTLAGTGKADIGSFMTAISHAIHIASSN